MLYATQMDNVEPPPTDSPVRQSRPTSLAGEGRNVQPPDTARRHKRRTKISTRVLHQLGGAIAEVALKDSRLNRAGEFGAIRRPLYSITS